MRYIIKCANKEQWREICYTYSTEMPYHKNKSLRLERIYLTFSPDSFYKRSPQYTEYKWICYHEWKRLKAEGKA